MNGGAENGVQSVPAVEEMAQVISVPRRIALTFGLLCSALIVCVPSILQGLLLDFRASQADFTNALLIGQTFYGGLLLYVIVVRMIPYKSPARLLAKLLLVPMIGSVIFSIAFPVFRLIVWE